MKLKTPIEIDFLGFFKTGKFDCLKLGQSKEWILNNFPNPDSRFDLESEKIRLRLKTARKKKSYSAIF